MMCSVYRVSVFGYREFGGDASTHIVLRFARALALAVGNRNASYVSGDHKGRPYDAQFAI
jgi:hypothetical protein